jgi:serine protease Do
MTRAARSSLPLLLVLLAGPALAQPLAEPLPSLSPLVESVKAAVVNVEVRSRSRGMSSERFGGDIFEHFFGRPAPEGQRERLRPSAGSGFLIDPGGLILTNNHVIENAVVINVGLDDGRKFEAEVVGRDPLTDVALIRIKRKVQNLPIVKLGNSDQMRVGDWVVAIGNPFGLASSVSAGIVSATARNVQITKYDELIQTDAAINPGNSGGPLFNLRGEVVGINTAIVGGGTGIGFAVPSNLVRALLPQLQQKGEVDRGFLGVNIQDLTPNLAQALKVPQEGGAIVIGADDKSPATKGGVKVDDVIVSVDGEKVSSSSQLSRLVALKQPGSVVKLGLFRGGKKQQLDVTLGERPDLERVRTSSRPAPREEDDQRQRIGVVLRDVDPRMAQSSGVPRQGALVARVAPGSPAEQAQLAEGMVVVEAEGKPVKSAAELTQLIREAQPGAILLLRVQTPDGRFLRALQIPQ